MTSRRTKRDSFKVGGYSWQGAFQPTGVFKKSKNQRKGNLFAMCYCIGYIYTAGMIRTWSYSALSLLLFKIEFPANNKVVKP